MANRKIIYFFKNSLVFSGLSIVSLLIIAALFAPFISPHDPVEIHLDRRLERPGRDYPLGTDNLGRCIFSRIVFGARLSLGTALAVSMAAMTAGLVVGTISGFSGGFVDSFIMRIIDALLAFPSLILALAISGILGPGLFNVMAGVALVWWAGYARLIRGMVLSAKEKEFVESARASGARRFKIIKYYIMPQVTPSLLVLITIESGWIILAVSGLSFLGLGAQPPAPEWGVMLNEARIFIYTNPWQMVCPGFAVTIAVFGFNLLGEGLRDVLQPKETTRW